MTEISVEAFINQQERDEYPLYAESLQAIKTALLDHHEPLEPLAATIAAPILEGQDRYRKGLKTDYSHGRLWRVIAAAIKQMTSQIDRIVQLVVAITQVPDPSGYLAFNQDMNEHWNEFAMSFKEPNRDDPERTAIRQAWINMNTFNAKISALGIERLNESLRSGHVFRIALEETPWEQYHVPDIEEELQDDPEDSDLLIWRDEELERRSVRRLNYWAPAAATWIENDGKGIYNMREPMIGDDYGNFEPTNWSGARGYSKQRFQYWRERFGWVATVTALDHDTRKRAARAAELMKQIEAEG